MAQNERYNPKQEYTSMNRFSRPIILAAVAAFLGVLVAPALRAQTDYSSRKATSFLTVGLGLAGGASMILDPPEGSKVGPIFAYRITAETGYPLSPSISALLGLGLDNRGTRLRSFANTDVYTDTRVGYFAVTPGFSFSSFYIGMNFGFPMSGGYTSKSGPGAAEQSRDMTDAEFEKVETLLEPRIGAVIPIINNKTGWLSLSVIGGISLNELIDRGEVTADAAGDLKMVCGQIGVSYQFSIPGTGK